MSCNGDCNQGRECNCECMDKPKMSIYTPPVYSEWNCRLFGAASTDGIHYRPVKGRVPNRFVRWMMKVCFDCTWVKDKQ